MAPRCLNSGATSYHLRQLAEYCFVVDVPDRGNGRDRWWKAAAANTVAPAADTLDGEEGLAYLRSVGQVAADTIVRAVDEGSTLPETWREASEFSDYRLTLTAAEARELGQQIHALLKARHAADLDPTGRPAEDAARVTVQFQLFPTPGEGSVDAAAEDHR